MNGLIPLHLLEPGQIGTVSQLVGQTDQVHRLEELGLRSGTEVEMVQPGVPCIIRLSGHKLCFRDCGALSVLVQPGEVA